MTSQPSSSIIQIDAIISQLFASNDIDTALANIDEAEHILRSRQPVLQRRPSTTQSSQTRSQLNSMSVTQLLQLLGDSQSTNADEILFVCSRKLDEQLQAKEQKQQLTWQELHEMFRLSAEAEHSSSSKQGFHDIYARIAQFLMVDTDSWLSEALPFQIDTNGSIGIILPDNYAWFLSLLWKLQQQQEQQNIVESLENLLASTMLLTLRTQFLTGELWTNVSLCVSNGLLAKPRVDVRWIYSQYLTVSAAVEQIQLWSRQLSSLRAKSDLENVVHLLVHKVHVGMKDYITWYHVLHVNRYLLAELQGSEWETYKPLSSNVPPPLGTIMEDGYLDYKVLNRPNPCITMWYLYMKGVNSSMKDCMMPDKDRQTMLGEVVLRCLQHMCTVLCSTFPCSRARARQLKYDVSWIIIYYRILLDVYISGDIEQIDRHCLDSLLRVICHMALFCCPVPVLTEFASLSDQQRLQQSADFIYIQQRGSKDPSLSMVKEALPSGLWTKVHAVEQEKLEQRSFNPLLEYNDLKVLLVDDNNRDKIATSFPAARMGNNDSPRPILIDTSLFRWEKLLAGAYSLLGIVSRKQLVEMIKRRPEFRPDDFPPPSSDESLQIQKLSTVLASKELFTT